MNVVNAQQLQELMHRPLREKVVYIDGVGYRLRELTEEQGTQYELSLSDKKGNRDISGARRTLIALSLIDADGNRVCNNADELKRLPRGIAGILWEECIKLSEYNESEIEQLVKNSEGVERLD